VAKLKDLAKVPQYKTFAYLFDSFSNTQAGGTGNKFNWKILAQAARMKPVMFVSGGLTAGNVRKAIKLLRPDWVDASSGLESRPGKKDHQKIKRFIQAVRQEDRI
jgi:phosphoribosylanthranilate isomerase